MCVLGNCCLGFRGLGFRIQALGCRWKFEGFGLGVSLFGVVWVWVDVATKYILRPRTNFLDPLGTRYLQKTLWGM